MAEADGLRHADRPGRAILSRAALGVTAFPDFFDDLRAEGFEISGIAGGNDALVDNDLRIFPSGTGIHDVGLDGFEGGHATTFGNAGLDEQPRGMAYGGND